MAALAQEVLLRLPGLPSASRMHGAAGFRRGSGRSLFRGKSTTDCTKKLGRSETSGLSLEAVSEGASFQPWLRIWTGGVCSKDSRIQSQAAWQPVVVAARLWQCFDLTLCVCVCVRACVCVSFLSFLPFAFGLSYQTAAVPESCPLNTEE